MMQDQLSEFLQQRGITLQSESNSSLSFYWGNLPKAFVIKELSPWLFPKIDKREDFQSLNQQLTWVAAFKENVLAFAVLNTSNNITEIISFKTHPDYRNQKIGSALVEVIEKLCQSKGIHQLRNEYRTYWESSKFWSSILKTNQWSKEILGLHYISMDEHSKKKIGTLLLNKIQRKNQSYSVQELTATSFQQLKQLIPTRQWDIAKKLGLSPTQLPERPLCMTSSFLVIDKSNNQVVGWLISHQLTSNIVQMTSFYTFETNRDAGTSLLVAFIEREIEKTEKIHFAIRASNRKLMRFVQQNVLEYGATHHQKIIVSKQL